MAVRTWAAFTAGMAVGWGGRSALGSGRELVIRGVVALHQIRELFARTSAEQVEWVEDMFAEGRARYETQRSTAPVDEDAPARVVSAERDLSSSSPQRASRGRAA
jgi:hypothetical protein